MLWRRAAAGTAPGGRRCRGTPLRLARSRHRTLLVGVSPAGWRVALPVAERVHGLEVAVTDACLVYAAVGVQLVGLRRPRCGGGGGRRPGRRDDMRGWTAAARRENDGRDSAGDQRSAQPRAVRHRCLHVCVRCAFSPVTSTRPGGPGFRRRLSLAILLAHRRGPFDNNAAEREIRRRNPRRPHTWRATGTAWIPAPA